MQQAMNAGIWPVNRGGLKTRHCYLHISQELKVRLSTELSEYIILGELHPGNYVMWPHLTAYQSFGTSEDFHDVVPNVGF